MDRRKRSEVFRNFLLAAILFMCGVLWFDSRNDPAPIGRTLILLGIIGAFGYALSKIEPNFEKRPELIAWRDITFALTLFVGGIIGVFVALGHWHFIKVAQMVVLVMILGLAVRLTIRMKRVTVRVLCTTFTMATAMVIANWILKDRIELVYAFIYSIMFGIMSGVITRDKSHDEISAVEGE